MNFAHIVKNHDSNRENKSQILERENFNDNKIMNKNNSDFNLYNNKTGKDSNIKNENMGFKKLINRKIANQIHNNSFLESEDKDIEFNKEKINVHQSAMANQYHIKIGDVNLNDHFYKEKINVLEEENKNLKEKLKTVRNIN